jgi:hypothetical protein
MPLPNAKAAGEGSDPLVSEDWDDPSWLAAFVSPLVGLGDTVGRVTVGSTTCDAPVCVAFGCVWVWVGWVAAAWVCVLGSVSLCPNLCW